MESLPKDPMILLSYINTQLRDFYPSLSELCESFGWNKEEIVCRLGRADYHYNPSSNRFM